MVGLAYDVRTKIPEGRKAHDIVADDTPTIDLLNVVTVETAA